jgi:hypothetical protein
MKEQCGEVSMTPSVKARRQGGRFSRGERSIWRRKTRQTQSDQLSIRRDRVGVLSSVLFGGHDAVDKANDGDDGGCGELQLEEKNADDNQQTFPLRQER